MGCRSLSHDDSADRQHLNVPIVRGRKPLRQAALDLLDRRRHAHCHIARRSVWRDFQASLMIYETGQTAIQLPESPDHASTSNRHNFVGGSRQRCQRPCAGMLTSSPSMLPTAPVNRWRQITHFMSMGRWNAARSIPSRIAELHPTASSRAPAALSVLLRTRPSWRGSCQPPVIPLRADPVNPEAVGSMVANYPIIMPRRLMRVLGYRCRGRPDERHVAAGN